MVQRVDPIADFTDTISFAQRSGAGNLLSGAALLAYNAIGDDIQTLRQVGDFIRRGTVTRVPKE
jgi:hypothetical protein